MNASRLGTWPLLESPPPAPQPCAINMVALCKGEERYVFLFDDAHRAEILRMLGKWAANIDLSFSWYDAATLSQRVRLENAKAQGGNDGND